MTLLKIDVSIYSFGILTTPGSAADKAWAGRR
jgi:hypothetical protein